MAQEARPVASVLVWQRHAGTAGVRHLRAGDTARFGACECRTCDHDIATRTVPAGYVTGRFRTCADHWRLDNLGEVPLTVRDAERPYHPFVVPAGRLDVVIPFELSEVLADDEPLVTVFGPEPRVRNEPAAPCPRTRSGGPVAGLDHRTAYFAVLVTLCEPWLRTGNGTLPSYHEIARSLQQRGVAVTPRAVEAHIDYLVGKLQLRGVDSGATRAWRKEALARAALRRGLVGPEHLPTTAS